MRRLVPCERCDGRGEFVSRGYDPQSRRIVIITKYCRTCGGVGYFPVVVPTRISESDRRTSRRKNKKGNQA
jgi:DnaJ-class molecular chaperone